MSFDLMECSSENGTVIPYAKRAPQVPAEIAVTTEYVALSMV